MAEYLAIVGNVRVNPALLNGNTAVLDNIVSLGIPTDYTLKQSVVVEILSNERSNAALRYEPKPQIQLTASSESPQDAQVLEVKAKTLEDAEAAMRSEMAFQLARYFAAKEMSPHAGEVAPIGKELSDFLN